MRGEGGRGEEGRRKQGGKRSHLDTSPHRRPLPPIGYVGNVGEFVGQEALEFVPTKAVSEPHGNDMKPEGRVSVGVMKDEGSPEHESTTTNRSIHDTKEALSQGRESFLGELELDALLFGLGGIVVFFQMDRDVPKGVCKEEVCKVAKVDEVKEPPEIVVVVKLLGEEYDRD